MGMPPPILMLALVVLIGIAVAVENAFMRRRKPHSRAGDARRRRSLARAERRAKRTSRRDADPRPISRFREPLHARVALVGVGTIMGAGVVALLGWLVGLIALALIAAAIGLAVRFA